MLQLKQEHIYTILNPFQSSIVREESKTDTELQMQAKKRKATATYSLSISKP